ncbi:unnamed protein product [Cylindrotheca closterium]|uniref:VWFA domain-containing protein n=1 Tax=Cylindrotheca closterium TaxID=2856 RepID=A0AAD2G1S8_9STRA|nr:unnamed protein product [Cylindrotheca closterium]
MMMIMISSSQFLLFLVVALMVFGMPASAFQVFAGGPLAKSPFSQGQKHGEQQHYETLQKTLGIPNGLMNTLLQQNDDFSRRIWLVDNSGSMRQEDGHKLAKKPKASASNHKEDENWLATNDDVSRWSELQETVLLHAQLSAALHQPTEFRLLNIPNAESGDKKEHKRRLSFTKSSSASTGTIVPSSFRVGYDTSMKDGFKEAQSILSKTKPSGQTPLLQSLATIREEIVSDLLPQLKADGTKVAIVIVTDGAGNHNMDNLGQDEASLHQEFMDSIRELLEGLPVTVVLRLCTDYGPIVDLYNQLDAELDGLDVLDDYHAEASEVAQHNPWLNYALILHRMREMGQSSQLFDLLDERTLSRDELAQFCQLIFGTPEERGEGDRPLPDPNTDWIGFLNRIQTWQKDEKLQFNPLTKKMAPWVDVDFLSLFSFVPRN